MYLYIWASFKRINPPGKAEQGATPGVYECKVRATKAGATPPGAVI